MTDDNAIGSIVLQSGEPASLLSHMTAYGLASILETENPRVRLAWTGGMKPRLMVSGPGLSEDAVAETLIRHAKERAEPSSWLTEKTLPGILGGDDEGDEEEGGKPKKVAQASLMSPRMASIVDWGGFQRQRHAVLDRLGDAKAWVDLRLIWSLGEPSYWGFDKSAPKQDWAASKFDMRARYKGTDILNERFAKIARLIAGRSEEEVVSGLRGLTVGGDEPTTKDTKKAGQEVTAKTTEIGFRGPGSIDGTIVWCALWGISQFPLAHFARKRSASSGNLELAESEGPDCFYVPVWKGDWSPGRLRSMLASGQLRASAGSTFDPGKWLY